MTMWLFWVILYTWGHKPLTFRKGSQYDALTLIKHLKSQFINKHDKYLGVPMVIGRSIFLKFGFLVDRLEN